MKVVELRRYPVKAMGGESLSSVELDRRGLAGDRWYAVTDDQGRLACGKDSRRFRRRDRVFDWAARTDASGVLVSNGQDEWRVDDHALDPVLTEALGDPVRVLAESTTQHQDGGQIALVGTASLAWCREHLDIDADHRRLRANVLVETAEPFIEESWVGSHVRIGGVELRLVQRIQRCRTVDLAQDGVSGTTPFLKALAVERDLCLGVYAEAVSPGVIAVGDLVLV